MAIGGNTLAYKITVDEKGAVQAIDKFEKKVESSNKKGGSSFAGFATKATVALAGVYASFKTLEKAYEMSKIGSKLLIQEKAFANLASSVGSSSDKIIKELDRVAQGTISNSVLMEKAGTAMLLGIPADKLDDLMKIARASMKITGQTAEQAFGDIALAVGRGSKMILDNLGIILDVEKANENYAQSIGKTVEQLTDQEKKTAFLNATLEAGKKITDSVGDDTKDDLENVFRISTEFKDLWDNVYKLFAGTLAPFFEDFAESLSGVNDILDDIIKKHLTVQNMQWSVTGQTTPEDKLSKHVGEKYGYLLNPPPSVSPLPASNLKSIDPLSQIGSDTLRQAETKEFKDQWAAMKEREQAEIDLQDSIDEIWNKSTENYRAELEERALIEKDNQEKMIAFYAIEDKARLDAEQKKLDEIKKMNEETYEQIGNVLSSNLADALTNIATGAEDIGDAFSNMAKGIIADLARIASEALSTYIITSLLKAVSRSADGNIFSGGSVMPFASGGIVGGPTFFPMANGGVGLMGEAGPEAVMPLTRTSDGKLGVESKGGSYGAQSNNYTININAVDAKSFNDLCRRNPSAITNTFTDQINRGNQGLRQSLRKGAS